jgi:hypothetical protein
MTKTKCPCCGIKLGNFLYADACPQCGEELTNNTKPLIAAKKSKPHQATLWPVRLFLRTMRLVES